MESFVTINSKKKLKKIKNVNLITFEMAQSFNKDLKKMIEPGIIKVNHDVINKFERNETKELISFYKSKDKNWYINSFQVLLLENNKIPEEENLRITIFAKYLSLYASQSSGAMLGESTNKLLEAIILNKAYLLNEKLGEQVQEIFNKISDTSIEVKYGNVFSKQQSLIWSKALEVSKKYFTFINNEYLQFDNFQELTENILKYYFIKSEILLYLKAKNKSLNIINDQNYEEFSAEQMILLDKIRKYLVVLNVELSEKVIAEITELDMKVNLSDLPPMTYKDWFGLLLKYALLILWAVIILYPVYVLLKQSFNDKNSKVIIDIQNFIFTTNTYKSLFSETLFLKWLLNSTMIALANMFFTMFIVSLTAYSFSRFKYKGKSAFLIALLVTQMIPSFTSIIVYYIMTELLKASFEIPPVVTLIFIYTGAGVASNTVILKGYMDSISQDIDDAARIDGCSHFWIYSRIIMPLCKPMIVLIALMSFIGPFGDVILPQLILKNQEDYTVAVGLNMFINSERLKNFGGYFAGATLVSIPIVILFISLQKYVVAGLTTGGVKG